MYKAIKKQFPDHFILKIKASKTNYITGAILAALPNVNFDVECKSNGDLSVLTETPDISALEPYHCVFNPSICKQLPGWNEVDNCKKASQRYATVCDKPFEVPDVDETIYLFNQPEFVFKTDALEIVERACLWVVCSGRDVWNALFWYGEQKLGESNKSIFRYSDTSHYYKKKGPRTDLPREALLGYDHVIEEIEHDIKLLKSKRDLFERTGRPNSMNYLFYGEPGTGKTTMIKVICSIHNFNLYIVSFNLNLSEADLSQIMTPPSAGLCALIIEDFDRYLESEESMKQMSTFLNALDGVENSNGVVRFFTANNTEAIYKNKALMSRLQRTILFDKPTCNSISKRVSLVFPGAEQELVTKFSRAAVSKGMTLRDVTNYLFRYALREDGFNQCISNLDLFLAEKELISTLSKSHDTRPLYM
jgi:hypothetical protein